MQPDTVYADVLPVDLSEQLVSAEAASSTHDGQVIYSDLQSTNANNKHIYANA